MTRGRYAWLAYSGVGLCFIGAVAWPLWSESMWWPVAFGVLAALVIAPVVFSPAAHAVWESLSVPHDVDHD